MPLSIEFMVVNARATAIWTQCFIVPFLDSLVFVLALGFLEVSMSLIFGIHFSNLPQFFMIY